MKRPAILAKPVPTSRPSPSSISPSAFTLHPPRSTLHAALKAAVPFSLFLASSLASAAAGPWPQWRGPLGTGVSEEAGLPLRWSVQNNVAWKASIPGFGASTPAIWNQHVFLTTQDGDKLLLLALDKTTGDNIWTREVGRGQANVMAVTRGREAEQRRTQKFHRLHNLASPSPVTDGEIVIAHFGNGDLAAYDFTGKKLWFHDLQKEHGGYTIWWGHANSPVLCQDLVISVCMQDPLDEVPGLPAESYLVAHDKRTGQLRWKTLRSTSAHAEQGDSYTTPILYKSERGMQLIVMGGNQIDGYDPTTGKQLWFLPGITGGRTITGPTLSKDLVYATQGMRGPLLAIKLDKTGKLEPEEVAWKLTQGTADSSCPVVWHDWLFFISDNGIAHCLEAQTGKVLWKERIAGDFKASPIAADGRVYFLNLEGVCTVVKAGPKFEILATNAVGEKTIASLAVSDAKIYMRGDKSLFAIGAVQ
jgi:outer membrane protein assembly factor BamB